MANSVWLRRGDGLELYVDEGSEAYQQALAAGAIPIDETGAEIEDDGSTGNDGEPDPPVKKTNRRSGKR
jgi:hypothetical protein